MKINKKLLTLMTILVVFLSLIMFGLTKYNSILSQNLKASTMKSLNEIVQQQKSQFESKLWSNIACVEALSVAFTLLPDDISIVVDILSESVIHTEFQNIFVANVDGVGVSDIGVVSDVSNREYFTEALKGKTVVSEPMESLFHDDFVVPIATPIYVNNRISGVLVCSYVASSLNQILIKSFDGNGYSFIVNENGFIIASNKTDYITKSARTIKQLFDSATFSKDCSYDAIIADMSAGKSGNTEYHLNDELRYVQYTNLNINDWYIFSVIPTQVISSNTSKIIKDAILLTVAIVAGLIISLLYVLMLHRKSQKDKENYTAELERVAYYDELTGYPNFNKFKLETARIISENSKMRFVFTKFDIVNFKVINELFGFDIGDDLVKRIANLISGVRIHRNLELGCFARINADEFIVFDIEDPVLGNDRNRTTFETLFKQDVTHILGPHNIEFRYGRYISDAGENNIGDIIEKVNLAHRMAKTQKSKSVCEFDSSLRTKFLREVNIEQLMHDALIRREFKVYLQPKFSLVTEQIVGAEALVRWQRADGGLIPPNDFIPLFERNSFILQLDMYMLDRVSEIISEWMTAGIKVVPISVNFSRLHLQNPEFVEQCLEVVDKYAIPRNLIEFELTETIFFNNEDTLIDLLNKLHAAGFTLSMDDFGTGYSSLGLLKNLPVDVIKIDKGFFDNNRYESRAKTVIESVIQMAKQLEIYTVAEGIETKEHVDLLKEVGCDIVQGYYYARPMPAIKFKPSE